MDGSLTSLSCHCSVCEIALEIEILDVEIGGWMAKKGGPRCPWCQRALDHERQVKISPLKSGFSRRHRMNGKCGRKPLWARIAKG